MPEKLSNREGTLVGVKCGRAAKNPRLCLYDTYTDNCPRTCGYCTNSQLIVPTLKGNHTSCLKVYHLIVYSSDLDPVHIAALNTNQRPTRFNTNIWSGYESSMNYSSNMETNGKWKHSRVDGKHWRDWRDRLKWTKLMNRQGKQC